MGLSYTDRSPILGQKTRPYNNQQKREIAKVPTLLSQLNYRIKLKECEKKDKYLDFARELKKLLIMKVIIISIVIGAFCTVTKGLLNGLGDLEAGGQVDTIQTTELLRTVRILRRVLGT